VDTIEHRACSGRLIGPLVLKMITGAIADAFPDVNEIEYRARYASAIEVEGVRVIAGGMRISEAFGSFGSHLLIYSIRERLSEGNQLKTVRKLL
jgi:hypothetical protein